MTEPRGDTATKGRSASDIASWLLTRLADLNQAPATSLDVRQPFTAYGMGSLEAVAISGELSQWLGRDVSPTVVYDYPNIEVLARYLAEEPSEANRAATPRDSGGVNPDPIAVIGLGCRFPGAKNPGQFWKLLHDGVDGITELKRPRWDGRGWARGSSAEGNCKTSACWGGFLEQVDQFDAEFFGIAPREAEQMDPQQRLLLEVSWEALEDAGQAPDKLSGSATGVFVGLSSSDYSRLYRDSSMLNAYTGTGNAHSIAANRLSYLLDLRGPSLAVDTACSSSLVAVHLACESLRHAECDLALAGGVNLMLSPELTVMFSHARMMAGDNRCKTFDAEADGYVRGEGCGVVVLKRLSDAERDGNQILGIVRGSAVNQDGRSNGLTAPNGPAQEAVIRQALLNAGVAASDVSYVEAHGTGTPLGDPIEFDALKAVLMPERLPDRPCAIGSVKTNIGHLEAAAGIAAMIKVVLAMRHGVIPAHLHLKKLNPKISLQDTQFWIPSQAADWIANGKPRIAGVSSFGFGGTNVHVILEEASRPKPVRRQPERPRHLLTLSAQSQNALLSLAGQYEEYLAGPSQASIADVCFTANTGRAKFPHRLAVTAPSVEKLRDLLASYRAGRESEDLHTGQIECGERPKVAFLFTGQGSQYPGMGRQLYETQPAFRRVLEQCDEWLRPHLEQRLLEALYPDGGAATRLQETAYAQPALFAVECALAQLWRSWGIEPGVVLGHSVGEYAAAWVAGVFSLEEGIRLVAARGRLMQGQAQAGEMVAVFAPEEKVAAALAGYERQVAIGAVNGAHNTVISGERVAVQAVLRKLEGEGFGSRRLNTSHAFHAPLMDPVLAEFERAAGETSVRDPRIKLVSNVTGTFLDAAPDARYWARHARETVRFSSGVEQIRQMGCELFLEIGPNPTLLGLAQKCSPGDRDIYLPTLRPGRDDWQQMLRSLAALYVRGVDVDWRGFDAEYPRRCVSLPTYPFDRKCHWIEPGERATGGSVSRAEPRFANVQSTHPLLGARLPSPLQQVQFECHLSAESLPYLGDHQLQDTIVLPAAAYLEIFLAAAAAFFGPGRHSVNAFAIHDAIALPQGAVRIAHLILTSLEAGDAECQFFCLEEGAGSKQQWKLHASGKLCAAGAAGAEAPEHGAIERVIERCPEERPGASYYQELREHGFHYGASFRAIEKLCRRDGEALAQVRFPDAAFGADGYQLHPVLLDAAFQLFAATLSRDEVALLGSDLYLPTEVKRYSVYGCPGARIWAHLARRSAANSGLRTVTADVRLFDQTESLVAEIAGLTFHRAGPEALRCLQRADAASDWLYDIAWREQARQQSSPGSIRSGAEGTGSWLVCADDGGLGVALSALLERRGQSWVLAFSGERYSRLAKGRYTISAGRPEDFERLLREVLTEGHSALRGIVYLWGAGTARGQIAASELKAIQTRNCAGMLHLLQAVTRMRPASPPRLWIVTRAAQSVEAESFPVDVTGAPLWGLGSAIALEHPELHCTRVDIDASDAPDAVLPLIEELWAPGREDQVAFRRGERYVRRLVRNVSVLGPLGEHSGTAEPQPFRLEIPERGSLDRLVFRPANRRPPGPGEVEVRVHATGLNFRDVMGAMAMYPGDPGPPGSECSGKIVALGDGVTGLQVGDEVLAVGPGCFSTFVTVAADLVVRKPAVLSFEQGAAVPIAFMTACLALEELAKVSPGDTVLVHAAAGGVGLAAVQVAQRAGATVIGTAGSPAKREFLKKMGVQHCLDSRSLDFAEGVMACTGGRGVDIVLNSLARDFIPRSLAVLAPRGRFVEIGKIGTWDATRVARCRDDISYFVLDLVEVFRNNLALARSTLQSILGALELGTLDPLPMRVFPIEQTVSAFRYMSRAKNIGKIVVSQQAAARAEALRSSQLFQASGTYLITGGLGGLGLAIARWMVENGARNLALLARQGPSSSAKQALMDLEKAGARVTTFQADVSDEVAMARVLADIDRSMPALKGIIHAAGVLDDGVLAQQDWARFAKVLAPKVEGAWNLHALTLNKQLDLFVLFSSAAAVLGSPGQGAYGAANAFLDALAHYRASQGLPAISIDWGPWGGIGMAASDGGATSRWAEKGIGTIELNRGLQVLGQAIRRAPVQLGVMPIRWPEVVRDLPAVGEQPLVAELVMGTERPAEGGEPLIKRQLLEASPVERRDLLVGHVRGHVLKVLGLDPTHPVDPQQPLSELGLDSLMAVELMNALTKSVGAAVPATALFDYPTIEALASYLATQVLGVELAEKDRIEAPPDESRLALELAKIEQLSEEDARALLEQKLYRAEGSG